MIGGYFSLLASVRHNQQTDDVPDDDRTTKRNENRLVARPRRATALHFGFVLCSHIGRHGAVLFDINRGNGFGPTATAATDQQGGGNSEQSNHHQPNNSEVDSAS